MKDRIRRALAIDLALKIEDIGTLDCGDPDCKACKADRERAVKLVMDHDDKIRRELALELKHRKPEKSAEIDEIFSGVLW